MMNNTLTLYTGPHCHLCDQAKSIIYPIIQEMGWRLHEVNIADDESLKEIYGVRIPVIANSMGEEKGWPFSAGQVKRLLVSAEGK
jgi:hypothetical protein|tara:strand:- start:4705 stop:4959 length:255 start_codon:yes stop_codon:yes gene_type:complete